MTRTILAALVGLSLALTACAAHEDEAEAEKGNLRAREPLPAEAIAARFPGLRVGVSAQIVAGRRRAAIVWPGFRDGAVIDSGIMAVAFDPQGQRWRPRGEPLATSNPEGAAALRELLGRDDLVVERVCGHPRESLPELVRGKIDEFKRAYAEGDVDTALQSYESLTTAFAFEVVAYDDLLTEWLILAVGEGGLELTFTAGDNGDWYQVEASAGDRGHQGAMPLVRCADGWVLGRPLGA
ncbi:MAG: hypothetical protein R3B09_15755 [Nannocystaceae bacterium]